jgi:hypothetical protein
MPMSGRHLLDLPAEFRLAHFGEMDGQPAFAEVRTAWNEHGLGVQWEIRHKRQALYGEPDRTSACDGMSLWLDMRDTRTIHRASRYCHRFVILGHNGQDPAMPVVIQKRIARALEDAPPVDASQIRLLLRPIDEDGDVAADGRNQPLSSYRMEVFLPASVLHGFDPEVNQRLGICYRIRDRELGDQILAPGPEFPFWEDPSLWSVLELVR